MKTVKDLSELDTTKTYRATVHGHPEWGICTLSHNGNNWSARIRGGLVAASSHWWNVDSE